VRLLWEGYRSAAGGEPFNLEGPVASDAGYHPAGDYGSVYYDILKLDIKLLEDADGAIELASAHRSYSLPGITPYRITDKGKELLRKYGYPVEDY
jgi:hypothetical protein